MSIYVDPPLWLEFVPPTYLPLYLSARSRQNRPTTNAAMLISHPSEYTRQTREGCFFFFFFVFFVETLTICVGDEYAVHIASIFWFLFYLTSDVSLRLERGGVTYCIADTRAEPQTSGKKKKNKQLSRNECIVRTFTRRLLPLSEGIFHNRMSENPRRQQQPGRGRLSKKLYTRGCCC